MQFEKNYGSKGLTYKLTDADLKLLHKIVAAIFDNAKTEHHLKEKTTEDLETHAKLKFMQLWLGKRLEALNIEKQMADRSIV